MVKVGPFRRWSHEVDFLAFNVLAADKKQIEKLKNGDIVAIVYNKFKGVSGNGAFEVYGFDAGLRVDTAERDVSNADTQGAFSIKLMSDQAVGLEPFLPKTLFITDYATSLAVVEGLYTP